MQPWMADLAKEIVVSLLSVALGAIWHKARGVFRDVNCYFNRVREMERRLADLERVFDAKDESQRRQVTSPEQGEHRDPHMGCRNDAPRP